MPLQPPLAAPPRPVVSGASPGDGAPAAGRRGRWEGVRRDRVHWVYWSVCAGFALMLAVVTTIQEHRVWGGCAAVGYGAAALLARRAPRSWSRTGAIAALVGAVGVPLAVLMVLGAAQPEVGVVEHSAGLLLGSGSPYAAHPLRVDDFNPYLPGMAIFGLPHVLLGGTPLGDARFWFAGAFLVTMALAVRHGAAGRGPVAAGRTRRPNTVLLLVGFPAVALPLTVGGVDLPVIGLMCLALALAGRGGSGTAAGLAMGAAAALKWTAWPLLPVGLALVAVTAGRRAAARAGLVALGVAGLVVVPVALVNPRAFTEHVVLFPLGAAGVTSPATSPLPGYLLATYVPGGRAVAVAALVTTAVAMAVSLVVRPPRTVVATADRLALGLGLAMCLMPATRFGYLVYPLLLTAWFRQDRTTPVTGSAHTTAPRRADGGAGPHPGAGAHGRRTSESRAA